MHSLLDSPAVVRRRRSGKRVLLVAYAFPPVGGAGVQRPVKWVKYLQRAGWDVTVLTPENPSVPVLDQSLLHDVPEAVTVLRPRTWEPGYQLKRQLNGPAAASWRDAPKRWMRTLAKRAASVVLQPDPQILWYRNARHAAIEHLRQVPHDAIVVTAPPYSSFLIGTALKQRFGLPLVLDYRDEWDLSSRYLEHASRDRISQYVQEHLQQHILRHADAVVATTRASVRRLEERLQQVGRTVPTACIYNGFDEEDFPSRSFSAVAEAIPSRTNRFRLVYTGTLWNLTSIAPVVTAIEQSPELAPQLEIVCVGRKTPEQQALLQRLSQTEADLLNIDYCDHAVALEWLRSADGLCLLLSDAPGAERVVPAKLFEYLATRKDILAVLPEGEAAAIVGECQPGSWVHPTDTAAIARWLQHAIERRAAIGAEPVGIPSDVAAYSRARQTERLIALLEELTAFPARKEG